MVVYILLVKFPPKADQPPAEKNMTYTCPGCGATDEEKKSCCGGEEVENFEESSEEKEEDKLQEEFEKE